MERGEISTRDYESVKENTNDYAMGITEDSLWKILTEYSKKESSIGRLSFDLLLEIAKSKEKGINTKDLAIVTKQDSRSITGRIKKLEHLVTGNQIVYKGHVVKLLRLNKFSDENNKEKPYVSMREHLPTIVDVVKKSKNGIRQIIDLKRELRFDQDRRMSKSFITAISWLDEKCYLKKVFVVSPSNATVKIRCVKYLRDYKLEDKFSNDFEYESDSDDGVSSDERNNNELEDTLEDLSSLNATDILLGDGLMVEEDETNSLKQELLLNRFYPIQNQTYEIASQAGVSGISTMEVVEKITGRDYQRAFTKASEHFIETVGKQKKHNSTGQEIVRVYDFEGKKKFYRLFTKANFGKLTGTAEVSSESRFSTTSNSKDDLATLNKRLFVPLNNTLRFLTTNGKDQFFWNGSLKASINSNSIQRGRKRKSTVEDDTITDSSTGGVIEVKKSRKSNKYDNVNPKEILSDVASRSNRSPSAISTLSNNDISSNVFNVGGFSAGSLRSLKRQQAIIEVVKQRGGISYIGEKFIDDISKHMDSATIVDKKTVRGDIDLMVTSGKLNITIEHISGRRIVYLLDKTEEEITEYIRNQKDNKKVYSKDTLHNTDIFFFDQTEKNRFHRGIKSAERVRKYQCKSKESSDKTNGKSGKVKIERKERKNKNRTYSGETENQDILTDKREISYPSDIKSSKTNTIKTRFHLNSKSGLYSLILSIVITKSIKNEIVWEEISKLFASNSVDNLKRQWTACRVRMGYNGWKAYVDKWRKILVKAIKEEQILLSDVEQLALPKLIDLWLTFESHENNTPIMLYKSYAQNKKQFTFVKKSSVNESYVSLAMSSMVQREAFLLKKSYTTAKLSPSFINNEQKISEDDSKAVIRSILVDDTETSKDEIDVLENVSKEVLDKVIMDMAKEKQLYLRGSKLSATNTIPYILEAKGDYKNFEKAELFRIKVEEMFSAKNGILINEEIRDSSSWVLIDLISRGKLKLDTIPIDRKIKPLNYTTRQFDVKSLTPPLIVSSLSVEFQDVWKNINVPIPMGKAYSRLWLDSNGKIRSNIWKNLVSMVINEVLFNPGVTKERLVINCNKVISGREMVDICNWLIKKQLIHETPFSGFSASHDWYTFLS